MRDRVCAVPEPGRLEGSLNSLRVAGAILTNSTTTQHKREANMIDFIMNAPTIGDAVYNAMMLFGGITIASLYVADSIKSKNKGGDDERK